MGLAQNAYIEASNVYETSLEEKYKKLRNDITIKKGKKATFAAIAASLKEEPKNIINGHFSGDCPVICTFGGMCLCSRGKRYSKRDADPVDHLSGVKVAGPPDDLGIESVFGARDGEQLGGPARYVVGVEGFVKQVEAARRHDRRHQMPRLVRKTVERQTRKRRGV